MRTTLLGSLLDTARTQRRRAESTDLRLFEVGHRVSSCRRSRDRSDARAGRAAEPSRPRRPLMQRAELAPRSWRWGGRRGRLLRGQGRCSTALARRRCASVELVGAARHHEPFLHPARAAAVLVDGQPLGFLGELHPLVAGGLGPVGRAAAFEPSTSASWLPPRCRPVSLPCRSPRLPAAAPGSRRRRCRPAACPPPTGLERPRGAAGEMLRGR